MPRGQVAHQAIITPAQAAQTDGVFQNRWRALMSVDDGIAGLAHTVTQLGLWNKTYFFITSECALPFLALCCCFIAHGTARNG